MHLSFCIVGTLYYENFLYLYTGWSTLVFQIYKLADKKKNLINGVFPRTAPTPRNTIKAKVTAAATTPILILCLLTNTETNPSLPPNTAALSHSPLSQYSILLSSLAFAFASTRISTSSDHKDKMNLGN